MIDGLLKLATGIGVLSLCGVAFCMLCYLLDRPLNAAMWHARWRLRTWLALRHMRRAVRMYTLERERVQR